MTPKNQNPHDVPVENILWMKNRSPWQNPLTVILGTDDNLRALDGRPFLRVAELYNPTKCVSICHPDNFAKMDPFAIRVALGMEPLS